MKQLAVGSWQLAVGGSTANCQLPTANCQLPTSSEEFLIGDADKNRFIQLRFEMFNVFNHTQFSGINAGTNISVPQPNGTFLTGNAIFGSYGSAVITNNLRNGPVEGSNRPLGQFFGEYNGARDPRIIQLAVKISF